ncbi:MAG: ATP-dependent Clp protease ATP-binding subunit [Clostridia bacterium]|nr:ATP-dependent Clp protease ATP-binding subunit [Clostridia bacterium]
MASKFTQKAQNTLNRSLSLARELGHTYIGSEHLLLGLLAEEDSIAARLLLAKGADSARIRKRVIDLSGSGSFSDVSPSDMTPRARRIIEASAKESAKCGNHYIGTEHLLLALLNDRDCMGVRILDAEGIPSSELRSDVNAFLAASGHKAEQGEGKASEKPKIHGAPTLSAYGRDLTALAKEGRIDPVIGRESETERLIRILSRRTKNNPCLIGEPGVGKTAVVEGLALRMAEGAVPSDLAEKRLVTLDLASMIAGAKYRGEFEDRMKRVMEEARKNSDLILFVDELHMMMGAGAAEGAVDAANIIKPALARGELQMIGATTVSEYRKHIERDAALERRFQAITVEEPTPKEAEEILRGLKSRYEEHHALSIGEDAIAAAVRYSVRYIPDRFLPDKAIDLLDEAAAKVRLAACAARPGLKEREDALRLCSQEKEEAIGNQEFERAALLRDREQSLRRDLEQIREAPSCPSASLSVSAADIAAVVTGWTGIPVRSIMEEEGERLFHLENKLKSAIVGQDDAIDGLVRAIRRGRCGLKDPRRPIGSFLFLGQTGVGKTELSRTLARELFGSEQAMVRLDMSEYMEKHSVSRLIGAPPGYVGYGEGGQLTEPVRRRPYTVILLDEIEKAHHELWHILLQLLEDGRLTDSGGRVVDFTNTVIIMTSNLGADGGGQKQILGFSQSDPSHDNTRQEEEMRRSLRGRFPPEFLNRLDEILFFRPLEIPELTAIAEGMLAEIRGRARELDIELLFDPSVPRFLATDSFERTYGARPLRRALVRLVEDPLSLALLEGRIGSGDRIMVRVQEETGQPEFHRMEERKALCRASEAEI